MKSSYPVCGGGPEIAEHLRDQTRIAHDHRRMNDRTSKLCFNGPRIEDLFPVPRQLYSTVFTKLDARSGFHQIHFREAGQPNNAFWMDHDLWMLRRRVAWLAGADPLTRTIPTAQTATRWAGDPFQQDRGWPCRP